MSIIFLRRITSAPTATGDGNTRERKFSVSSLRRILGRNSRADPDSLSAPAFSGEGGSPEHHPVLFPKDVPPSYADSLLHKPSHMSAQVQHSPRPPQAPDSGYGSVSPWTPSPAMAYLPPAIGHKRDTSVSSNTTHVFGGNDIPDMTPHPLHRASSEMRLSPRLTLRRPHPFRIPTLPTIDVTLLSPSQVSLRIGSNSISIPCDQGYK